VEEGEATRDERGCGVGGREEGEVMRD